MTKLVGKKVVVLGGTSGIGLATAKGAVAAGASVVVASSRKEKVTETVAALGKDATGHAVNLVDEAEVKAFFERTGALDHLVFTAGESLTLGLLEALDVATAHKAFELRFFGAMMAAKHAAPRIRAGGSIVFTHGVAGYRPQAGWAVAAGILGAMESLTRALAVELAPLRVNAVCPGFVRTPLWDNIPEAEREAMYTDVGKKLLVGRVGEAEDLAETYLYLMQNSFTTGQTLVVDGGGVLV